ncbi:MAG TPA: helix-turn-helix domain-containing protein [Nitrospiraceae bacterium]|nr:helix-turn-helix domain-containing protein [Nitrospiraceae bacterium]
MLSEIIPPALQRGMLIDMRSSVFSLLLLTGDPDLQAQLEQEFKKASIPATITVAKDIGSLQRAVAKRTYDGVILETKRSTVKDLAEVQREVDPSHTFILAGSRSVLRQTVGTVQAIRNGAGQPAGSVGREFSLEDYLEFKLGDFVKGMKNGSARNLHPMLIRAVERPLISHALRETNGNQIQAAHLLGMNRNTLRKKIAELHIPVKREKAQKV